jgi:hypothetical protein
MNVQMTTDAARFTHSSGTSVVLEAPLFNLVGHGVAAPKGTTQGPATGDRSAATREFFSLASVAARTDVRSAQHS